MAYVHKGKETIKAAMSNTSLVLLSLSSHQHFPLLWHLKGPALCEASLSIDTGRQMLDASIVGGDDGWRTSLAKKILMIILLVFNVFFSFLPPAQNSFFPPFFVLSCTFSTHISKK